MKLVFYDDYKLGAVKGNSVVDLTEVLEKTQNLSPQDRLNDLIENFVAYRDKLERTIEQNSGVSIHQVKIRPPVPKPTNIVAMAVNYMEDGTRDAPAPINAFHKSPNAIIGQGDTMVLPDVPATIFEGEAELAFVVGKKATNVKAENAYDHIFGYLNFIDGSARGLPPDQNSFYQMKSRDTFAPMGPYLVTADEINDPLNLQVKLWVNEEIKQNYNTSDMAHKIPRIVEWISSIHTLNVGDVVTTGTNHRGLSAFRDGDTIKLEVESLGSLIFTVQDDLKRGWLGETRHERAEKGLEGPTPQISGKYAKE
ncbi:fumarylacetoacetate hydrolase family protein [SAR202 cluster bacterium AD-802-E10_MRT_200m]|nr:fumarylacetoacetate hydrolase family protein [SAR202 cluster bacterium AD-802-E10_MRT_200m]